MEGSLRTGISFRLTSVIITTLGLMVSLHSGRHSKNMVLAGILTIAIADAFSDAQGIHVSEEAENKRSTKQIWAATISTFLAKFLFAMTFVLPVILFTLSTAVAISLVWGAVNPFHAELLYRQIPGGTTLENCWGTPHDSHRSDWHYTFGRQLAW